MMAEDNNDVEPEDYGPPDDFEGEPAEPVFEMPMLPEPPKPINWNLLRADDAKHEWLELNSWVNWLRHTYGLPASIVPPFWYRHPELVWELSALHLHWLSAYDSEQNGSAPIAWHHDFAEARQRLRDWVAASGTRLDRDRPTRQTVWPGEDPAEPVEDILIPDRDEDFVAVVLADVERRRAMEEGALKTVNIDTGEVD